MKFWEYLARIIIRNRIIILLMITGFTVFMGYQWKYMRMSYAEANLLPDDHPVNEEYKHFLNIFGEEGNTIIIGIKDSAIYKPQIFNAWNALTDSIIKIKGVETALSIGDLKKLVKDTKAKQFRLKPLVQKTPQTKAEVKAILEELFNKLPFYKSLLFNESGTIQSAIYIDKSLVNTEFRKPLIQSIKNTVDNFNTKYNLHVRTSGMPYIRTLNAKNITDEIALFVIAALVTTSLLFFFFFRSVRATLISGLVVIIGVMWSLGTLGLLGYEITALTGIIPPLIIVIGIPNAIFLITKYQNEIKNHQNKAKALQRVITKIGNATLMTNLTTAAGFATFIFTKSKLLKEFGIVASINIMLLFVLSLVLIPIFYSFLPKPKERHLRHLSKNWIDGFINWILNTIKHKRLTVYIAAISLLIISFLGMIQIRVSGSLLEDMPKDMQFYRDIKFFEKEFGGVLPLEIMIDTKKKKGVMKLSTLKKIAKIQEQIEEIPELSQPISVVNLVKYSKQAFYNGNPKYYQLPSSQEKTFILSYAKKSNTNNNMLHSYVDSTGRYARITTFMKDIGSDKMDRIEEMINQKAKNAFKKSKADVTITGKAKVFTKGTHYLVTNLFTSLALAILLIALFIAWMFKSWKMIIISLLPNFLPLLITAGMMGYIGIPIKPSTILVFSIAFGISVDDTIHFLAKYRQELVAHNWKIHKAVYATIHEVGVSMFYTSVVLFFGFSVFLISSFGGTQALGGLVSFTLLVAMLSNLIFLPTLLMSLAQKVSNKKDLKKPTIVIEPKDDE